jgi:hypothetical protein
MPFFYWEPSMTDDDHPEIRQPDVLPADQTYIIRNTPTGPAIHCLRCGMISYCPGDIKNRYCAKCAMFHEG